MTDITPIYPLIPMKEKIITPPSFNDNMGQNVGNLKSSPNETSVGEGNNVFKVTKDGIHLGNVDFASAPFSVTMTGALTASDVTLTGGTIKYGKTSFADTTNAGYHISSSGFYFGSASDAAYIKYNIGTGSLSGKFAIETTSGSSIGTGYLSGLIAQGNLNIAQRGWTQTSAFSVTDADTVAWGAGTFTASDGTAYSIDAGNTGNMSAKTYIYLDTATSTTVYQTTTTSTTAVGAGKVLIAIAQNGTGEATFQVMQGQGGQNIDAANIVAGSITTNEISAGYIYAGTIAVSQLTAGTITSKAISLGITAGTGDCYISGGLSLDYTNWTADKGFILGLDDSDSDKAKFFVGDNANDKYTKFDGTDLISSGMVIGQKFTVGENITAGNAVGFGSYNSGADYSETQDDTDYTFHNWVDTYSNQDNATTNYLTSTTFLVGNDQALGVHAQNGYFYFDMDSIPDYFTNVKFRFYVNSITNGTAVEVSVRHCTSQWNTVSGVPVNRGNLTHNNQPTAAATSWGGVTINSTGWFEVDITNLVLYWKFGALANYGIKILSVGYNPTNPNISTYATISSITGANPPVIRIDGLEDVGKIYQTSIDSPLSIYNFKGFAYNTATAGNKCLVQEIGIVPNLTGLVANKYYYIHSPDGAITEDTNAVNTFGAQYQVGRASSTTTLLIEKGQKIQTGSISLTTANSYGNIATYFKPTRIEFYRTTTGSDITSHGVAYEQAKQMHETKNGSTITTDTTYVYNDATNTMKVICIGQSATLLQKGGAGALTLNYIAYS